MAADPKQEDQDMVTFSENSKIDDVEIQATIAPPNTRRASIEQAVIEASMLGAAPPSPQLPVPPAPPKIRKQHHFFTTFVSLDRTKGLSDAIFAIVITLLAVEMRISVTVPDADKYDKTQAILGLWSHILAYFAAVWIIGVTWQSHVYTFAIMQSADSVLSSLNLFFLMWLSLVPFSITLVIQWPTTFYSLLVNNVILTLMALSLLVLWIYCLARRSFIHGEHKIPSRFKWIITWRYIASPICYASAIGFAAANYWVGVAVTLIPPFLASLSALHLDVFTLGHDSAIWIAKQAQKLYRHVTKKKATSPDEQRTTSAAPVIVTIPPAIVTSTTASGIEIRRASLESVRFSFDMADRPRLSFEQDGSLPQRPSTRPTDSQAMFPKSKTFHVRVLERIKTFGDAVFAIVLTLLVLEIHLPKSDENEDHSDNQLLGSKLIHTWPYFISFIITFSIISTYWKMHSLVHRGIEKTERVLLYLNVVFLSLVSLVPVASGILALYYYVPVSPAFFNLLMMLIGIVLFLIFISANLKGRLKHEEHRMTMPGIITGSLRLLIGVVMYAIAFGLAFANVYASIAVAAVMPAIELLAAFDLDIAKIIVRIFIRCYAIVHAAPAESLPKPAEPKNE